jgi:sterol O-acyltransferase
MATAGRSTPKAARMKFFKNFAVYQLISSLVFELEFPHTQRFVLVAALNVHDLILLPAECDPYFTLNSEESFMRTWLDLSLPFMLACLLLFYIIFGASSRGTEPHRD